MSSDRIHYLLNQGDVTNMSQDTIFLCVKALAKYATKLQSITTDMLYDLPPDKAKKYAELLKVNSEKFLQEYEDFAEVFASK